MGLGVVVAEGVGLDVVAEEEQDLGCVVAGGVA